MFRTLINFNINDLTEVKKWDKVWVNFNYKVSAQAFRAVMINKGLLRIWMLDYTRNKTGAPLITILK